MSRPVHAVVVAYHAPEPLDRALASVDAGVPVTVVDNSQSDAVRAVCERHGVRYVRSPGNLGFAAGVNVALREILAGQECDVLLLNPDAVLPPGAVERLAEALLADPRAGAVTPCLLREGGKPQRSVWPFPSPWRAWVEALGLGRLNRQQGFAVGAVLLLRREALGEVGLFDERFFLYAEEADWERRALAHGWHATLCETVTATHLAGATSDDSAQRERLFYAAQELYIRKWYGSRGWLIYRLANIFGAGLRAVVLAAPRRGAAARRLRIYLRGPCRAAAA